VLQDVALREGSHRFDTKKFIFYKTVLTKYRDKFTPMHTMQPYEKVYLTVFLESGYPVTTLHNEEVQFPKSTMVKISNFAQNSYTLHSQEM
jgi:hypothetical protein